MTDREAWDMYRQRWIVAPGVFVTLKSSGPLSRAHYDRLINYLELAREAVSESECHIDDGSQVDRIIQIMQESPDRVFTARDFGGITGGECIRSILGILNSRGLIERVEWGKFKAVPGRKGND